jgi:hypothetical protein
MYLRGARLGFSRKLLLLEEAFPEEAILEATKYTAASFEARSSPMLTLEEFPSNGNHADTVATIRMPRERKVLIEVEDRQPAGRSLRPYRRNCDLSGFGADEYTGGRQRSWSRSPVAAPSASAPRPPVAGASLHPDARRA